MRKTVIVLATLVVLCLVALIALRCAFGLVVGSDEFRTALAEATEHQLRHVLPHAMVEIGQTQATGVFGIELDHVALRSGSQLTGRLALQRITLAPQLTSLILPGPVRFSGEAQIGGGGMALTGSVPFDVLLGGARDAAAGNDAFKLTGTLAGIDAAQAAAFVLPGDAAPNVRLGHGTIGGTFHLTTPLGRNARTETTGDLAFRLDAPEWVIPSTKSKTVATAALNIAAQIAGGRITLSKPVVLSEKLGHATVSGSLVLPVPADGTLTWDLDVDTNPRSSAPATLVHIFKCKHPPDGARFKVRGPLTGSDCTAY